MKGRKRADSYGLATPCRGIPNAALSKTAMLGSVWIARENDAHACTDVVVVYLDNNRHQSSAAVSCLSRSRIEM